MGTRFFCEFSMPACIIFPLTEFDGFKPKAPCKLRLTPPSKDPNYCWNKDWYYFEAEWAFDAVARPDLAPLFRSNVFLESLLFPKLDDMPVWLCTDLDTDCEEVFVAALFI